MYSSHIHSILTKHNFLTDAGCQTIKYLAQKYMRNDCACGNRISRDCKV
jgi:hypothetical protein